MKLKFDPSLQYQQDAVNAVVGVFGGQPLAQSGAVAVQALPNGGLFQSEFGMGNRLTLPEDEILKSVHRIQEVNGIEKVPSLQGREFSIEMETGTGKTYVYLRTIFELNKVYGFKKFIIVVPSVAIREGVLKSIDVTKEHFQTLYDKAPFDHFVTSSTTPSALVRSGSSQAAIRFKSWSSTSSRSRRMLRIRTSRK
jgi:type III restriction enzyme